MRTSRNTNSGNRGAGSYGGPPGPKNKKRSDKKVFQKYMQEKLAITVLVITLALFALVMVLYRIIRDNNEQYNKIVLSQSCLLYTSRCV